MARVYSKLTTKSQTTIPKEVRDALGLRPRDIVIYDIDGTRVTIGKADGDLRGLQATLSEWDSPEDAAAFDDL
jgi:antitoxin PrlF